MLKNKSWLISKCDRCGDQTFFYNIFVKSLINSGSNIIYITNEINTYLTHVIKESYICRYEINQSLNENISKYNESIISNKCIIIICPFVPYEETSKTILDDFKIIDNWIKFLRNIKVDITVCGTINPSWVDLVNCSMVSSPEKFYGLLDKPSQIVPDQFKKFSNFEIDNFINIRNEIASPENYFVTRILNKFKITHSSLSHSSIKGDGNILFFVGASSTQKCYNFDSILRIGKSFTSKHQNKLFFIYGPNEFNLYKKYCGDKNYNHIYFESSDFVQLINLINSAKLAFTHDTFYYHLLNLYGIPHVLVSGGGHWRRFVYRNSISTIITNRLPCFNCDWSCPYDKSYCITEISEKALLYSLVERYNDLNLGFKVYNSGSDIELFDYTDHFENESLSSNYIARNNVDITDTLLANKEETKRISIELSKKEHIIDNLLFKQNENFVEINRLMSEKNLLMHKLSLMNYKFNNIYLENEKNKRFLDILSRVIDHKFKYIENNNR